MPRRSGTSPEMYRLTLGNSSNSRDSLPNAPSWLGRLFHYVCKREEPPSVAFISSELVRFVKNCNLPESANSLNIGAPTIYLFVGVFVCAPSFSPLTLVIALRIAGPKRSFSCSSAR